MVSFEQPKSCIQGGISKIDVHLPINGVQSCAIHPRIGIETFSCEDEALLEGAFRPMTTSEDASFSCSRQWTVVALSRTLKNGQQGIQLIILPLGTSNRFVLCQCLVLPENYIIKEVGFYGDDGKSTLFSGEESGNGKEGRQSLGLLLENGLEQELWLIPYDKVLFEVIPTSGEEAMIDLSGLEIAMDSVVHVLPKTDETEDDDAGPNVVHASSKFRQVLQAFLKSISKHSFRVSPLQLVVSIQVPKRLSSQGCSSVAPVGLVVSSHAMKTKQTTLLSLIWRRTKKKRRTKKWKRASGS